MSADKPFELYDNLFAGRSASGRDAAVAEVTIRTRAILNQTRPWVLLFGVLMWIGAALLGLPGGAALLFYALSYRAYPPSSWDGMFFVLGLLYFVPGVLCALIAKPLTSYASRIKSLNSSQSVRDLEDALEAQKKFWRVTGILAVVCLVLSVMMFSVDVWAFSRWRLSSF